MQERQDTSIEVGHGISQIGTAVKEGFVGSLKGIPEIEAEMVSLVCQTVSDTLRATGATARETLVVTSSTHAAFPESSAASVVGDGVPPVLPHSATVGQ